MMAHLKNMKTLIKLKPKEYDYYYDWAYMLSKAKQIQRSIGGGI